MSFVFFVTHSVHSLVPSSLAPFTQDGQINRHELIQAIRHDPVVVKMLDLPANVPLDGSNEHAWSGTLDMRFQAIDDSGNEIIDLDEFLAYFANGDANVKDKDVGRHEGGREGER